MAHIACILVKAGRTYSQLLEKLVGHKEVKSWIDGKVECLEDGVRWNGCRVGW